MYLGYKLFNLMDTQYKPKQTSEHQEKLKFADIAGLEDAKK